jgi:hypothetical protein
MRTTTHLINQSPINQIKLIYYICSLLKTNNEVHISILVEVAGCNYYILHADCRVFAGCTTHGHTARNHTQYLFPCTYVDGHVYRVYHIGNLQHVLYLMTGKEEYDLIAVECANVGVFSLWLGLITGMMWAKYTWGEFWSNDPKQNSAAIAFLLYCAYLVLRNSIDEEQKRGKISSSIISSPSL